jgi:hypothetical protein
MTKVVFRIIGSRTIVDPAMVLFQPVEVTAGLQRNPIELPLASPQESERPPHIPILRIFETSKELDALEPMRWLLASSFTAPNMDPTSEMTPGIGMIGGDLEIAIRPITWQAINSVGLAQTSIPGGLPDRWLRMTYFSVVTIATLGYGDIVPITTRARIVVGLEVLLGTLLYSLFIGAVGTRIALACMNSQRDSKGVP